MISISFNNRHIEHCRRCKNWVLQDNAASFTSTYRTTSGFASQTKL